MLIFGIECGESCDLFVIIIIIAMYFKAKNVTFFWYVAWGDMDYSRIGNLSSYSFVVECCFCFAWRFCAFLSNSSDIEIYPKQDGCIWASEEVYAYKVVI